MAEFAQQADRFQPPDQFPFVLADPVPGMSEGAPVQGTAAV